MTRHALALDHVAGHSQQPMEPVRRVPGAAVAGAAAAETIPADNTLKAAALRRADHIQVLVRFEDIRLQLSAERRTSSFSEMRTSRSTDGSLSPVSPAFARCPARAFVTFFALR